MINPSQRSNPVFSPNDRVNPVNGQQFFNGQGYNTFDLSENVPTTVRFGECTPLHFYEGIPGDKVRLQTSSEIKANGLVAPLLSEIRGFIDTFSVPYSAMYPRNWDKMLPNPTKGDDIPDDALPCIPLYLLYRLLLRPSLIFNSQTKSYIGVRSFGQKPLVGVSWDCIDIDMSKPFPAMFSDTSSVNTSLSAQYALNSIIKFCFIFGADSLLQRSGLSLSHNGVPLSSFCSDVLDKFQAFITSFTEQRDNTYIGYAIPDPAGEFPDAIDENVLFIGQEMFPPYRSLSASRDWLYRTLSQGGLFFLHDAIPSSTGTPVSGIATNWTGKQTVGWSALNSAINSLYLACADIDWASLDIEPSSIVAYNMANVHLNSVDAVDYIYTAHLYLQNLESCLSNCLPDVAPQVERPQFIYNGVHTLYDVFTKGALSKYFAPSSSLVFFRFSLFLANVFSFHNSLRYRDYFSGSRPNVVAVGDVSIPVDSSSVDAIDVTQNLLKLRFLNAVNRTGNRLYTYLATIFGVVPSQMEPEPHFISRQRVQLNRNINTNTANDLGEQNTSIQGSGDTASLEVFVDEPCIVFSQISFDFIGSYRTAVKKRLFNLDRFQKFNPMIQDVGDQAVSVVERFGQNFGNSSQFGYVDRYGEYKMPVSIASGGAVNNLPGWFAFYDDLGLSSYEGYTTRLNPHISPSLVRHYPVEFDQFYKSLTSIDPSQYFHFVLSVNCGCVASRKMNFNSGILWSM